MGGNGPEQAHSAEIRKKAAPGKTLESSLHSTIRASAAFGAELRTATRRRQERPKRAGNGASRAVQGFGSSFQRK